MVIVTIWMSESRPKTVTAGENETIDVGAPKETIEPFYMIASNNESESGYSRVPLKKNETYETINTWLVIEPCKMIVSSGQSESTN